MAPSSDADISYNSGPGQARPFSRWYFKLLPLVSVIAALLFGLSGYLYRWDVLELGAAFTLLRYTSYVAMGLGVLALVSLFFAARSRFKKRHLLYCVAALLFSGGVSGVALYWNYQAQNSPFLHDVTTDTRNPPEFDVIAGLRADAPNPPEYQGAEVAELQREGYPDIITTFFVHDRQTVFYQALALIESRGWNLAQADGDDYIIEATEVLPWFGFKDDVVIRLKADGQRTLFDMRSKSRVGGTDLGVNANRVRAFTEDLRQRLRSRPVSSESGTSGQQGDADENEAAETESKPETEPDSEAEPEPEPEPETENPGAEQEPAGASESGAEADSSRTEMPKKIEGGSKQK